MDINKMTIKVEFFSKSSLIKREARSETDINKMTIKDFRAVPRRDWNAETECNSVVFLPAKYDTVGTINFWLGKYISKIVPFVKEPEIWNIGHMHDSGYRCMEFVAIKEGKPVCRIAGCSDVINLNGIGGYGYKWLDRFGCVPEAIEPIGWSIDCLPTSGLFHLFCGRKIIIGHSMSNLEIYAKPKI